MDYAALKSKYGAICIIPIGSFEIYYRPLSWEEADIYQKVVSLGLVPEGELAARLFRDICLNHDLVDLMSSLPAGVIYTFFRVVLHLSNNNLQSEDQLVRFNEELGIMRASIRSNPYENMIFTICKAFPSYNPSSLAKLPYYEVLRLMVMAEAILELEPFKLNIRKKKSGLTDQIFEDARRGQSIGAGRGAPVDVRDVIKQRQQTEGSFVHDGLTSAQQDAVQRVLAQRKRR